MGQIIGIRVQREGMNMQMDSAEIIQILKDLKRLSKSYQMQFLS